MTTELIIYYRTTDDRLQHKCVTMPIDFRNVDKIIINEEKLVRSTISILQAVSEYSYNVKPTTENEEKEMKS